MSTRKRVLRPWQVSTICLLPVTDPLWSEMVVRAQDWTDPTKETPGGPNVSAPEPSGRRRWPGANDSCRARTPPLTGECRLLQNAAYLLCTCYGPAVDLARTCHAPHAQARPSRPPCCGRFADDASGRHQRPARIARRPRRSAPGHPVPPATRATQAVCNHARPCQDVRHAGNRGPPRRARGDARGPRDANTRSGCQFASPRASRCAFLLRLVSLAPLFTLADACLTLPMGSQTDTSGRVSDDCRAQRADGVRRRARKAETT
jgi:hypothetical protein